MFVISYEKQKLMKKRNYIHSMLTNYEKLMIIVCLWKLLTAWIMKNRSHSIVLNHLINTIMEHHQTRWYEVLKTIIGNWVE